jgi:hypothetical protein
MYPEMLHALTRARQEDLLRDREFREGRHGRQALLTPGPVGRLRFRAGRLLVTAGSRLAGPSSAVELLRHQH